MTLAVGLPPPATLKRALQFYSATILSVYHKNISVDHSEVVCKVTVANLNLISF